jgi:sugar phosphate isomerase/epimerase
MKTLNPIPEIPFVTGVAVQRYLPAEDGVVAAHEEGCTHWYIDASLQSDAPNAWSSERVRGVTEQARERGLRPIIHGNFRAPLASEMPEIRAGVAQYVQTEIDLAAALNAEALILHGGAHVEPQPTRSDRMAALERLFAMLQQIIPRADDRGVTVWLENLSHYPRYRPFSYVFTRHEDYSQAVSALPGIRFILDVGHANVNQSIALQVIRDFHSSLAALSLSNNDGSADSHLALDQGTISTTELATTISETNWTGVVAFETRNADVRSGLAHLARHFTRVVPT